MNEIFWILFISLSVICVLTIGLIITISINRRRARESKKLREHIDLQTKIYNEMIEKHTTQIKDYFEKIFEITHNPMVSQWAYERYMAGQLEDYELPQSAIDEALSLVPKVPGA